MAETRASGRNVEVEGTDIKFQDHESPKKGTTMSNDDDPTGLRLFKAMRAASEYFTSAITSAASSDLTASSTTKDNNDNNKDNNNVNNGEVEDISEDRAREILHSTDLMEHILPVETWKTMEDKERHLFLDKFYPIRQKYQFEREGREMCAFEEMDLYKCHKDQGTFSATQIMDSNLPWDERVDVCSSRRKEYRRCVRVMTVFPFISLIIASILSINVSSNFRVFRWL
jgi:hypothetical protein